MKARRTLSLAAVALTVAGATAGITYALWGTDASSAVAVVRTGDLDLEPVGGLVVRETSADVTPTHAVAMRSDMTTVNHLATPGDSFVLQQQFRTRLEGDNVRARLNVRWQAPPSLVPAGGVSATYVVTAPDGVSSAPVALGTAVTVPADGGSITPADVRAWGTAPWVLTLTLRYTGTSAVVVPPSGVATAPMTGLGTVVLELAQVRDGTAP
ncbi:hypothetical protein ACFUMH_06840 [Cellulomonas sp. NPDC057328]|uniref:hypothetical protein n=1 Tax=Cellulomonas sp. NPDC057328 TaxID=3346101 RepID=UPI003645417A